MTFLSHFIKRLKAVKLISSIDLENATENVYVMNVIYLTLKTISHSMAVSGLISTHGFVIFSGIFTVWLFRMGAKEEIPFRIGKGGISHRYEGSNTLVRIERH